MSSDNLEALDNKALKAKCDEYGLPNIPITDTSRKVIIKRLRSTMDGTAGKGTPAKNRRETIHVTKIPVSMEPVVEKIDSKRPAARANNRRTIAATPSTTTEEPAVEETQPAAATQRRRSSRASVTEPEPVTATKSKRSAAILEEDDDDDLILVEAVEKTEKYPHVTSTKTVGRERSSRSVSLTKSPVVSTSYNKETVPQNIQETESETETEIRDAFKYSSTTASTSTAFDKRSSVEPENFDFVKPSAAPAVDTVRPFVSRYSTIGSYANDSSSKSSVSRRYTTSGAGISTSTNRYSTYVEDSSDVADDDGPDGEIATPYYSDFARRLERLKKEQVTLRNPSVNRDVSYTSAAVVSGRKADKEPTPGVGEALTNVFHALDHKYSIKRKFYIVLSIFVLLAIYVLLFH